MTQKKIGKPAKARIGRPPTRGETATKVLPIRMTEAEHAAAGELARARDLDVSTMIRTWLAAGAPMPPEASPRSDATPEERAAPTAAPSVADASSMPRRSRKAPRNAKPAKRKASSATARRGRR